MKIIRRAASLLLALLRELADESAYQRYLAGRGVRASPDEWRRFSNQRLAARFGGPRCC